MGYNDAIEAVNSGKYAWRTAWTGQYIHMLDGKVYLYQTSGVVPYSPTEQDEQATDWNEGDRPPH